MSRLLFQALLLLLTIVMPGLATAQSPGSASPVATGGGGGPRFVFGPSPWRFSVAPGFFAPSASQLNETVDQWLPALPDGGWVVFANFALSTGSAASSPVARERNPGNANVIDWAVAFERPGGGGGVTPLSFFDGGSSATMPDGGFAMLWVPPGAEPRWLRYSITTPSGGRRPQGGNPSPAGLALTNFYEVRRWKAANASAERNGGAISGTAIYASNGVIGPVQLLVPFKGQASVLLLADSIGQQADDPLYLASPRNVVGGIARGLDEADGGRIGIGNFTSHGASMIDFMRLDPGYFAARHAILRFARDRLNGGRMWPMTAIWSELGRNDLAPGALGLTGTEGDEVTFAAMEDRYRAWWNWLTAHFPGVPILQSTITPKSNSSDQWTSLEGQSPREATPTILDRVDGWLKTQPARLVQVVDVAAPVRAAPDGSAMPKWAIPPYSASGGGTLSAAITTSTSATNGGAVITGSVAPQIGENLVIEPGTTNAEAITVRAVSANGDGTWTARGLGNSLGQPLNFARAHPAGAVVRSAYTSDGVHPATAMHLLMAETVKVAKRGPLSAVQSTP
ncbi:hypothetical protein [Sphingomonas sp.]|uniref:hypothetical protein n=1 Tax=Sphingomonas sp. TaxID=28214 RepID=UPI0031CE22E2